jgi:hypothetical protein
MCARDHRRHRRRLEGTRRSSRRHPRERAVLEGIAARSQAARPDKGTAARRRRWRAWLLPTNPIENTFATVRHRTIRSRGCLSNKTAPAMIFKLAQAAEKSWHRLRGYHQLPKVICGVKFNNGIEVVRLQAQIAAA